MEAYYQELYARTERAIAGRPLQQIIVPVRAIVGPRIPDVEGAARTGLEALKNGEKPTPDQVAALQAVIRYMRPSLISQRGEIVPLDEESAPVFPKWLGFCEAVRPSLYSVGRIQIFERHRPVGTGFLVSENVIVTNKHVLEDLSEGTMALRSGEAEILFVHEHQTIPDEPGVPIEGVLAIGETLDIALLKLTQSVRSVTGGGDRQPLRFTKRPVGPGTPVVTVGYPFPDSDRNPLFAAQIFGNRYGAKQLAPGEVIRVQPNTVLHDCSTLGGSSGSPLLCMETAELVGLHREGRFLTQNEAVDASSLANFLAAHPT